MKTITELRRQLQIPMRQYNDIGGLLFADWISIFVTWVFLRFGIGPTPATVGMLVVGLAGAALIPLDGGMAILGGLLVVAFYILDCVDGEVARYLKVEKYIWTFHDFFFGYFVKSAFFIALGIHAYRVSDAGWMLLFGFAAVLGMLFKVFLDQVALFLTARHVFMRTERERGNIMDELKDYMPAAAPAAEEQPAPVTWRQAIAKYGSTLGMVRGTLLNFHLSVLLFVALAIADLWLAPMVVLGVTCDLKTFFILFYGLALPFNFFDNLQHYIRVERFHKESARLIGNIRAQASELTGRP